jgi:hypothetical protein
MGASTDPQTQQTLDKIEQLLKDPIAGPKLMAIVNSPNTGVASNFSNIASAVGKQQTPSGQLGAGIGGALGMGLQALLKKKSPSDITMAGRDPSGPGVESRINAGNAPSDTTDYSTPPDTTTDYSDEDMPIDDFAKGGAVLARRPVISTTIVIAKKKPEKKPEKKRAGGKIQARKPAALPPRRGPANGETPAPFAKGGHVQSPRGSGCAERGKQFRGIY